MSTGFWISGIVVALLVIIVSRLPRVVRWAKRKPAGAYFMLALMPLISLFPVPPSSFRNLTITQEQQKKWKEAEGDQLPKDDDSVVDD